MLQMNKDAAQRLIIARTMPPQKHSGDGD